MESRTISFINIRELTFEYDKEKIEEVLTSIFDQ